MTVAASEIPRLYLQHIGHIKVKLHRPVEGKVKTVLVKREPDGWHVVFSCELGDAPEATGDGPLCGIDLGLKAFLVTSDGETVEAPHYYRKAQRRLRQAQKVFSCRKKGSNRRKKAAKALAKLHQHIANQRRDFHHKQARKLVERYGTIAHETLNVRGITRRPQLAKSAHDAAWAQFLKILRYKAEEASIRVVAVNPKNTTQACSSCGAMPKVRKTLSIRTHVCEACGYTVDRDLNAARNIVRKRPEPLIGPRPLWQTPGDLTRNRSLRRPHLLDAAQPLVASSVPL